MRFSLVPFRVKAFPVVTMVKRSNCSSVEPHEGKVHADVLKSFLEHVERHPMDFKRMIRELRRAKKHEWDVVATFEMNEEQIQYRAPSKVQESRVCPLPFMDKGKSIVVSL
ncbi:unnamed protein product [Effrenium voratum]|nr:unnamed protein product [Effrenium voratum]